ncbi:rhamnogalacturonan acetylesterase [Pedobacter sp. MC2016-14]|uniref:rhamnogalacturonan acetylesterase n=1 Tax=Pedobacter sp. MC2016-14 TaxID=2897327 RepID=UPI001E5BDDD8|nr:rhamnogalacturonan acetylesterase [Pedobacter sp. MC2016-14]MCD0487639.1 rhamnogalacturonan acetylesterase [Pedobacter sp. MC2016-14]
MSSKSHSTDSKVFRIFLFSIVCLIAITAFRTKEKPVLYIIGDSTVQNSDGNGRNEYWGWGSLIKPYLDTNKITLQNHAKAGTSTRTFILDGRWDKILAVLKKGDFVMMQFGHNDHSGVEDTTKQKGSLLGTGEETKEIISIRDHKKEIVHTYGWYLSKFIKEAKAKGAIPIVCSLVPRNKWKDGKVVVEAKFPEWAEETARTQGAYYIDLNKLIRMRYEQQGPEKIKAFFPVDGTHTNLKGAELNAACVVEGLKIIKECPLNVYIK